MGFREVGKEKTERKKEKEKVKRMKSLRKRKKMSVTNVYILFNIILYYIKRIL